MQFKLQERVPLSKLDILDEIPSPIKRKARIFAKKLPDNFFAQKGQRSEEKSARVITRHEIHTQGIARRISQIERVSQTRQVSLRGNLSSRMKDPEANTMNLIMGIISSSRQMKRAIRKHSLEMRKQNDTRPNIQNLKLQLPPLFLKKGVTTNF